MRTFEGKTALVTGATSGIGRQTAMAFAEAGARVVLAGRRAELGHEAVEEIRAAGGQAEFVRCDVADEAQVRALVDAAVERFGRLDCAFNNAGTHGGALRPVHELEMADVLETLATNLTGTWLCMKHEIRAMLEQSPAGGCIVNMSSINGLGGVARASIYSASKAGVLALTKSAAQEYGRMGIRINALAAGAYETAMLESATRELVGGDPERAKALRAQQEQFIPLARVGDPREAADVVLWLCSDRSSYVTGHTLIADGGTSSILR
ncbi:MAG TPA: glucose 1-dehydrogenase [Longimicrobium sp.]|jgi:NAD(P)-dependent dehydrogenase (short-subunit alcohol dehydrogenase family)